MGRLPAVSIQPFCPFTNAGLNYTGPFCFNALPDKGKKTMKGYVCLFFCLATKIAHLKVISDCSAPTFLTAFQRFVSHYGLCPYIYSDNRTNFQGADAELSLLFPAKYLSGQRVAFVLARKVIKWHFTSPNVPDFGGL